MILSDMKSLVTIETCGFTQPSIIISTEMCSKVALKDMSIFLIVVTTISYVVIPIVRVFIASYLV